MSTGAKPLPAHVRKILLPWWRARAVEMAGHLETVLETGESVTVDLGIQRLVLDADRLVALAEQAANMVERLEAADRAGEP